MTRPRASVFFVGVVLLALSSHLSALRSSSAPTSVCLSRDIFAIDQCQPHRTLYPPEPGTPSRIYLLYDVSPHEGFNLRRDVYIRLAVFVRDIRRQFAWSNITLVLPPFYRLPHWTREPAQSHAWHEFFDLPSLQAYVPVLDAWQYYAEAHSTKQTSWRLNYVELHNYDFSDGQFSDRYQLQRVDEAAAAAGKPPPPILGGLTNYTIATRHRCLFQGSVHTLQSVLLDVMRAAKHPPGDTFTVYIRNAEIVLHQSFGDADYWRARRSMRFASALQAVATAFRRTELSNPAAEGIVRSEDEMRLQRPARWEDEKEFRGAQGGQYMCAHLRRRDFLTDGRIDQLPTLKTAAAEIREALDDIGLRHLFLASDCDGYELRDFKNYLSPRVHLHTFRAHGQNLSEGAVAIVDQIICSQAAYFLGTYESTFTYRIQEEREIYGFRPAKTFNTFCGRRARREGSRTTPCLQNAQWLINY